MIDLQHRTDSGLDIESELERIERTELPAQLEALVEEYDHRIGQRDRYLWQWIYALLPHVTLSTVPQADVERAREAKTMASMYVVILDDLGERDRDIATFHEASKIPFDWQQPDRNGTDVDRDVIYVAEEIWSQFEGLIEGSPGRGTFGDLLAFDLDQTLNAVKYSYLVNENLEMANEAENWAYDCHNMMLLPYLDVDLMFSMGFDRVDLGTLRRGVWNAQKLARIGNWITTWEREIREGDFTSGVVVSALANGIVSHDELSALDEDVATDGDARIVDRIRDHRIEDRLLEEWETTHREARTFEANLSSVDFGAYLDGMETVLEYHLASRGLK